jgi:hypothetical protein
MTSVLFGFAVCGKSSTNIASRLSFWITRAWTCFCPASSIPYQPCIHLLPFDRLSAPPVTRQIIVESPSSDSSTPLYSCSSRSTSDSLRLPLSYLGSSRHQAQHPLRTLIAEQNLTDTEQQTTLRISASAFGIQTNIASSDTSERLVLDNPSSSSHESIVHRECPRRSLAQ